MKEIIMPKANTLYLQIHPIITDNEPYILGDNDVITFSLAITSNSPPLLQKKLTKDDYNEDNALIIKIMPEDTKQLQASIYKYDVALNSGNDFYSLIPPTNFVITETVTQFYNRTDGTGGVEPFQEITVVVDRLEIKELYFSNKTDFPAEGKGKYLYIAVDENAVYRYDNDEQSYICVGRDYSEIKTIQCIL